MAFDFYRITGPEDSKQENFSALCSCLLARLFPDVKAVEGRGGDEGLDSFIGDFNGACHVFQHKYFFEKMGPVQRKQVVRSLDQALKRHHVYKWTLMVPKDLTPSETRWFQGLVRKYPGVEIELWGKAKLQELLAAHTDIVAAFQPAYRPLVLVLTGKDGEFPSLTADQIAAALVSHATLRVPTGADVVPLTFAAAHDLRARPNLKVLVWGPGPSGDALYKKRCEIRDRLKALGHDADFSEDKLSQ